MTAILWPLLGALGMWLMECSYLPQLLRLHRRKAATDVSALFPAMNLAGRLCALAYAAHLGSSVLAAGFLVGVLVRATFLAQVIYYRWIAGGRLAARRRSTQPEYPTVRPITVLPRPLHATTVVADTPWS